MWLFVTREKGTLAGPLLHLLPAGPSCAGREAQSPHGASGGLCCAILPSGPAFPPGRSQIRCKVNGTRARALLGWQVGGRGLSRRGRRQQSLSPTVPRFRGVGVLDSAPESSCAAPSPPLAFPRQTAAPTGACTPALTAACPWGQGPAASRPPSAGRSQQGAPARGPLSCAAHARGQAGPRQAARQVCGLAIVSHSKPSKAAKIRAKTEAPGRGHQSPPCRGRPGLITPSTARLGCKGQRHSGISTWALPLPGEKPGVQGPLTWAHGRPPASCPPAGSPSRFPGAAAAEAERRLTERPRQGWVGCRSRQPRRSRGPAHWPRLPPPPPACGQSRGGQSRGPGAAAPPTPLPLPPRRAPRSCPAWLSETTALSGSEASVRQLG